MSHLLHITNPTPKRNPSWPNFLPKILLLMGLVKTVFSQAEETNVEILHTADVLGRYEETSEHGTRCMPHLKLKGLCIGGLARVQWYVNKRKTRPQNTIYIDAGNFLEVNSLWYELTGVKPGWELINKLNPMAMAPGLEDFNLGHIPATDYLNELKPDVLGGNLESMDKLKKQMLPSKIHEGKDHGKYAIIGVLSKEVMKKYSRGVIKIKDEVPFLTSEIAKHVAASPNTVIIVISPFGFERDKTLAKQLPDVDVIIGSNSRTLLYNGKAPHQDSPAGPYPTVVKNKNGGKCLIVHAGYYAKYVGRLNVTFKKGAVVKFEGNPVFLEHTYHESHDILDILLTYEKGYKDSLNTTYVAAAKVTFDGARKICCQLECNYGNMLADSMVTFVAANDPEDKTRWATHPIGFLKGGGIIKSIATHHKLTLYDVQESYEDPDLVVRGTITGRTLLDVLETSVLNVGKEAFLQYSGIHVQYDLDREPFERVKHAEARCGECLTPRYFIINETKSYNIITLESLTLKGGGYDMLRDMKKEYLKQDSTQMLEWYLKDSDFVHSEVEGRIEYSHLEKKSEATSKPGDFLRFLILFMFSVLL